MVNSVRSSTWSHVTAGRTPNECPWTSIKWMTTSNSWPVAGILDFWGWQSRYFYSYVYVPFRVPYESAHLLFILFPSCYWASTWINYSMLLGLFKGCYIYEITFCHRHYSQDELLKHHSECVVLNYTSFLFLSCRKLLPHLKKSCCVSSTFNFVLSKWRCLQHISARHWSKSSVTLCLCRFSVLISRHFPPCTHCPDGEMAVGRRSWGRSWEYVENKTDTVWTLLHLHLYEEDRD